MEEAVVPSTLTEPGWAHTTVLSGDPVEEVRRLLRERDGEVGVTGSSTPCHALIAAGVVDEYRLFVHPRGLGRGRRDPQRASTACGTKKLRLSVISPSLSRMPRPAGSPSTTQAPRTGWCGPSTPAKSGSGANSWTTKPSVP